MKSPNTSHQHVHLRWCGHTMDQGAQSPRLRTVSSLLAILTVATVTLQLDIRGGFAPFAIGRRLQLRIMVSLADFWESKRSNSLCTNHSPSSMGDDHHKTGSLSWW